MKTRGFAEDLVKNLLLVLPYWHCKIVRPFKEGLNREISLETYYCLETLRTRESMTMTELAQALKVTKQQATKLIDTLCVHGFAARVYDEKDRRLIRIAITPHAQSYLTQYYQKNTDFFAGLQGQLSDAELEELSGAVMTLLRVLPGLK